MGIYLMFLTIPLNIIYNNYAYMTSLLYFYTVINILNICFTQYHEVYVIGLFLLIMFGIVLISGKFYYTVKTTTMNCLCLTHCMGNFGFGCNGIELAINIDGSNCYSGSGYRKLCL